MIDEIYKVHRSHYLINCNLEENTKYLIISKKYMVKEMLEIIWGFQNRESTIQNNKWMVQIT